LLTGGILSFGSVAGLLAVFTIAVRHAIALIRHIQNLEEEGETFGPDLVLRGTRERFQPIVSTTITAGLALLPFALFGQAAGHEIVQPMAMTILGGLVTSMLLNLYVLPNLIARFGQSVSNEEPILGVS